MSLAESIAQQLFVDFQSCVPPPAEWSARANGAIRPEEIRCALDRLYDKARELRRVHRPGLLGRARIAFILQRKLLAAQYPAHMVREVLFSLIVSAFVGKA